MALSLSQLRQAVATQINGISGFTESRIPPDYFGRQENSVAHKRFAIQLQTSSQANERQRRAVGCMMQTNLRVKFAYRLRPKDAYPTDYDLALDAEQQVITAILASYAGIRNEVQIRYDRTVRDVSDSTEWMLFDIEFQTFHTISIT